MESLKKMQECLISIVEGQVYGNIEKVDAKELGEAIDMIKDLSEAMYYYAITEAMEGDEKEEKRSSHHSTMYYERNMPIHERATHDKERVMYPMHEGRHHEEPMPRDPHEGRSGQHRKMYMDGKGVKDKSKQMQELEAYMNVLAQDMTEMINDASPEEKQLLQNKLMTLTSKIK